MLLAVVLLAGWLAGPAEAQRGEDPLAGLTSSQRRVFQNYTRMYCSQFFRYDDDRFALLPNHERSRENSNGKSYNQTKEDMTVTKYERRKTALGNQWGDVKYPPPSEEVIIAARVIPAIDVGHFGLVNCVTVKDIVGPDEMIVTAIELISPDDVGREKNDLRKAAAERQKEYAKNTYRLLGFSTKNLHAGDKYYGPRKKGLQVAVVSSDPQHKFVLVNYDELKRVRTSEFAEALAYVEIGPLAFIDMVRENREELAADGDKASLIYIYRRFYNRYRPKRLSSITRPEVTIPKPEPTTAAEPQPEIDVPEMNEPKPDPKPEPKARPKPEPEEEEDDWDFEEDTQNTPDQPTFFGIPL